MTKAGGGFARLMNVERLGREPMSFDIRATEEECDALAAALDILGVSDVIASGSLMREGANGLVAVSGRISAMAVQACVVTLDPVEQAIDEEFTVFYTFDPQDITVEETEKVVGLDEPDPPTLITGGRIDLAEVIQEQIALALDPYPRRDDLPEAPVEAELDLEQAKKEQGVHQPFANLRDLMSKK